MAFSNWSENFSKNFGKWGWSASQAGAGTQAPQQQINYVPLPAPKPQYNINYSALYRDFQKREKGALAANVKRETEVRGIYDQLIGQGQGAFRTAGLADIEQSKTRAIGSGTQQMISSGLFGTTTAASIPVQAENQAALSRLKLEDIIQQRTSELKLGKAGFVERIEDPYPDYNMLIQAMAAGASR